MRQFTEEDPRLNDPDRAKKEPRKSPKVVLHWCPVIEAVPSFTKTKAARQNVSLGQLAFSLGVTMYHREPQEAVPIGFVRYIRTLDRASKAEEAISNGGKSIVVIDVAHLLSLSGFHLMSRRQRSRLSAPIFATNPAKEVRIVSIEYKVPRREVWRRGCGAISVYCRRPC